MKQIKKYIKKIIPQNLINTYQLIKINARKNKTYSKIEKTINKEYNQIFNKSINWEKPQTYTEKLNVSKLYCPSKIKSDLTDKIKVREWIKNTIGEEYLIPILGIYDKYEDIDFDKLPKKFVIKCNHDSGSVTVINDKEKINHKELKEKYKFFLKKNFALCGYEMHYKNIKPQIIVEKYLGQAINDYKFLCFNGEVYYCWVDFDRFNNHKRNIYDLNWQLQPFNQYTYGNYSKPIEKPEKYEQMVKIAKKLCQNFDHVRVDLYLIENKIYFGELTFTNGNGLEPIVPTQYDHELGKLWTLNIQKNNNKKQKPFKNDNFNKERNR